MGQIVQFRKRPASASHRPAAAGEAKVLMFTGVRYDRGTTPNQQAPHGATRGDRKRG